MGDITGLSVSLNSRSFYLIVAILVFASTANVISTLLLQVSQQKDIERRVTVIEKRLDSIEDKNNVIYDRLARIETKLDTAIKK